VSCDVTADNAFCPASDTGCDYLAAGFVLPVRHLVNLRKNFLTPARLARILRTIYDVYLHGGKSRRQSTTDEDA
jgi:hypothetical protein